MTCWDESEETSAPSADRTRVLRFLQRAAQLAGNVAAAEDALADVFDRVAGRCPEPRARWLQLKAAQARDFASHERREQEHWLELEDNWRDTLLHVRPG